MAHGGLRQSEGPGEVADARLGRLLGRDQAHEPEPRRVGEDPQRRRKPLGALLVQRSGEERPAAVLVDQLDLAHQVSY